MSRARPTDRSEWPARGPYLQLLTELDELRTARRPLRSVRETAAALKTTRHPASHEAVRSWLTGRTLPSAEQLAALVVALGGGADDRDAAIRLHSRVEDERRRSAARGAAPGPDPERLLARDRTALEPSVLHPMPRVAAVARKLDAAAGSRAVSVLVGDGGLGKSVLIGQLLDRVGTPHDTGWFPPSAVLVAGSAVAGGPALADPQVLDRELGRAAGIAGGVLDRLREASARFGSCALVLDTLDVILDDETFPALAGLLADAAKFGDVLISCRQHEFGAYFSDLRSSTPALVDRLREIRVPPLTPEEIVRWADAYFAASGPLDAEAAGFLEVLADGVRRTGPLRTVCSVPVRLALTCQVFASEGRVPVDLTVTELFRTYWATRVARHRGRGGRVARAKESTALAVAEHIVGSSGRLALRVPKGLLDERHEPQTSLLMSEGVLRDVGTTWEFFHQSFAEFAHARAVLSGPADSPQRSRLRRGIIEGRRNLWQIVGSMMLQADDDDYVTLVDSYPVNDPFGARWQVLGALRRPDELLLDHVLGKVAGRADALDAILPVLSDVPVERLDMAIAAAAGALREFPDRLSGPATATAAALLARLPPGQEASRLVVVLDAAFSVVDRPSTDVWDARVATVIEPFRRSGLSGTAMGVLQDRYERMGSRGRQATVRAATAGEVQDDDALAALGEVVLRLPCPSLSETEAAEIVRRLRACTPFRVRRGWTEWADVLFDELGDGWDHAQIRLVTGLAEADRTVLDAVVDGLVDPAGMHGGRLVSVFQRLLPARATEVTDRLVRSPSPSALGVGAVAGSAAVLAELLGSEERGSLARWLEQARAAHPRRVWPAVVALASSDATRLGELLDELVAAGLPTAVLTSALDAAIFHSSPAALIATAEVMAPLLSAPGRRVQQSRWAGRLAALGDGGARDWVAHQLLHGSSPRAAGTTVKSVVDTIRATGHPADAELVAWLATLLPSVHADGVQRIADTLVDPELTRADAVAGSVGWSVVLDRYRYAVEHGEDGRVVASLVELLNRLDTVSPLTPETVVTIYDLNRRRLPDDMQDLHGGATSDQSAAVRVVSRLAGTLLARRMSADEVWDRLESLLAHLDPARVGSNIGDLLGTMLIGFCSRDPRTLDWVEKLYRTPGVSAGVQIAVAKAVVFHDGRAADGRASRLKDHRNSSPEAIAHLLNVLDE